MDEMNNKGPQNLQATSSICSQGDKSQGDCPTCDGTKEVCSNYDPDIHICDGTGCGGYLVECPDCAEDKPGLHIEGLDILLADLSKWVMQAGLWFCLGAGNYKGACIIAICKVLFYFVEKLPTEDSKEL